MDDLKATALPWYRRKAWVLRNFGTPGFLIGAPAAYVLGMVTMWPTGWELPANTLTAITAALTSVAAVGGAIAVWHYQQDKESTATGAYILHVLDMPRERLEHVAYQIQSLEKRPTRQKWLTLENNLLELSASMSRVSSPHLERDELLLKLDPRAMEAIIRWLQQVLRSVNGDISELRKMYARMKHVPDWEPRPPGELGENFIFAANQYQSFYRLIRSLV